MLSMFNKVASEAPTLVPVATTWTSETISMVPRAILVGIPKAWKKEVFPGSIPVLPAGMKTSVVATAPARAGAATVTEVMVSRMVFKSLLVKTKPVLPLTKGNKRSYSGNSPRKPRMARRTMVFLPMRTTASPRSFLRMVCICWEDTLSTPTMKMDLYSSKRTRSFSKYSAFCARDPPILIIDGRLEKREHSNLFKP
ncbi:60S acidic ribosomal protein P0 [Saitoella complicata NRRL Y-17804]|uniref:60S acidic ribosomal protein P0 n=1 Tax=Saitoella complicata (strain BCRC 22490 / CBS 7301 / JCM 7358 / NBRC 10748 / NRRL Y-17804) TaxID=698492 RepID=UPI00086750B9|nr:60S acidic ribosomal protein P0 [Saitoella complicata NRRL Y-17804]ODQ52348.1 60S acidic ribosomal protein P0 [Saitoella complicata NRRL Y-17804]